jgi:hypothetical protein
MGSNLAWVVAALLFATITADNYDVPVAEQAENHSSWFGLLRLPSLNYGKLPEECKTPKPETCTAETAEDYEKAFSLHKERLRICGWHGFERKRMTGDGMVAPVYLMTTPCGLKVAAKFGRSVVANRHVSRNCDFMRLLLPRVSDPDCVNCFPKYYHYSNLTGVCYAELVHAMPMASFLHHVNKTQPRIMLQTAKLAMHQGMNALRIMQSEGMRHQDLTFRNALVRVKQPNDPAPFRVVIFDFGVSYMKGLQQDPKAKGGMGNHGFADPHAWACAFYSFFYSPGTDLRDGCGRLSFKGVEDMPANKLEAALLQMMKLTRRSYENVDYAAWQAHIRKVDTL